MLKTKLTQLFDIQYPIMSAPMAGSSGGQLAAAVSEGGGLGTFGGSNPAGPDWVREQIHLIRAQTNKPFGVGFITHRLPMQSASFDVALEENVPVITFSFADPQPWLRRAKDNGAITVCQVQTMASASQAIDAGADILVVQGNEAGGHTGQANLLPLLVRAVDRFPNTMMMAAGGIGNGRSLVAVLAAGAEGAWMGTAFLATPEAVEVSEQHKELILNSDGDDTIYTSSFDIVTTTMMNAPAWPEGIAVRARRNEFTEQWHGREEALRRELDDVIVSYSEARQRDDWGVLATLMGQSSAFVGAIKPAAEVLRNVCEEAEMFLRNRMANLLDAN